MPPEQVWKWLCGEVVALHDLVEADAGKDVLREKLNRVVQDGRQMIEEVRQGVSGLEHRHPGEPLALPELTYQGPRRRDRATR